MPNRPVIMSELRAHRADYLEVFRLTSFALPSAMAAAGADSYSVFNLAAGWAVSRVVQLTAGIDNLFDRDPNRVGVGTTEPAQREVEFLR